MAYFYIIQSKDNGGKFYIGSTNNIQRRLYEHNNSNKSGYTNKFRPWRLAYKEYYKTIQEARWREYQAKRSAWQRKKLFEKLSLR